MSNMEITEDERLSLRNKAKAELERLNSVYNDPDTKREIDDFKDKFLICEVVYKIILKEHRDRKYSVDTKRLLIDIRQVPHALKFAGYDFDKDLLTPLFSAEERVGKRSVKKLRDALTHKASESAVKELLSRKEELYSYMNTFLNKIVDLRQYSIEIFSLISILVIFLFVFI